MKSAYTADRLHGVEIMEIDSGETFMACAVMEGNGHYSRFDYWFTVGHYKSLKMAQKKAVAALAKHGYEIEF